MTKYPFRAIYPLCSEKPLALLIGGEGGQSHLASWFDNSTVLFSMYHSMILNVIVAFIWKLESSLL